MSLYIAVKIVKFIPIINQKLSKKTKSKVSSIVMLSTYFVLKKSVMLDLARSRITNLSHISITQLPCSSQIHIPRQTMCLTLSNVASTLHLKQPIIGLLQFADDLPLVCHFPTQFVI